ncbi:aminotransferase class IV [Streptomyces sp. NRRL B-1347]|uniref:aminotransferase class IV n=1 Tax=Streptomyces sp. NRRL B-1347 TaxID=1476877 RepID=UPI00068AE1AD|nr:aminotransferase class IV [Streptomyces sp. NRRL B-1347]
MTAPDTAATPAPAPRASVAVTRLDGSPATPGDLAALALYNYGHFTTLRVERGRVRGLGLHLRRLADDCRTLFGTDPDTVGRLTEGVRAALRRVARAHEAPLTVRVTVCAEDTTLEGPGTTAPTALLSTRPAAAAAPPPLRLTTATYVRELPEVKHTGLFGTLRLRADVRRRGFDDALLLDHDGHVLEGTTWNICFWDGTRLLWPRGRCLPGVTARLLREAAAGAGLPVGDAHLTRGGLGSLRAAFATNAAFGVRPVASVDEVLFAPDPDVTALTATLTDRYADVPAEPL